MATENNDNASINRSEGNAKSPDTIGIVKPESPTGKPAGNKGRNKSGSSTGTTTANASANADKNSGEFKFADSIGGVAPNDTRASAAIAEGGTGGTGEPIGTDGSGISSGAGNSSGGTTACPCKGKRGRHNKGCGCLCGECQRKIAAAKGILREVNVKDPNAPQDNLNNVIGIFSKAGITEQFKKSIAIVWEGVYQMPILMGYGTYWALNPQETQILTDQTVNVLDSIPLEHRKQIMNVMNSYLPISSFIVTVGMITYPRWMTAKVELMQKKANQNGYNDNSRASGEDKGNSDNGSPQRANPYAGIVYP